MDWSIILKNKKVIIWIVIAIVVIIVAIKLFKKNNSASTVRRVAKDVITENLSFDDAQYSIWADSLYRAMKGAGTTQQTIYDVLSKLKSPDDFYKLVDAFGVKKSGTWFNTWEGNLIEWLQDELSESEMTKVNSILKKIKVSL